MQVNFASTNFAIRGALIRIFPSSESHHSGISQSLIQLHNRGEFSHAVISAIPELSFCVIIF